MPSLTRNHKPVLKLAVRGQEAEAGAEESSKHVDQEMNHNVYHDYHDASHSLA